MQTGLVFKIREMTSTIALLRRPLHSVSHTDSIFLKGIVPPRFLATADGEEGVSNLQLFGSPPSSSVL
jgi:hypothetical protein